MLPLGYLSIAGRAAQQQHNSSRGGVWGCGTGRPWRQAKGIDRVTVEWRRGRRRTPPTHTHAYADSPHLAQPVQVAVVKQPLVNQRSEDSWGYTHSVATHTHTHIY
eukprot:GHVU01082762.1.p2 GENE.GHVU01082762.1~~GHVU01082762.1.p2  ORF type:complete len:106 (-),score=7.86 GHVU01082762.1:286-603(-)